jgi:Pyridoxamine 5'-phosphate oxidase
LSPVAGNKRLPQFALFASCGGTRQTELAAQFGDRRIDSGALPVSRIEVEPFSAPDERARDVIRGADTCFVSSATAAQHRERRSVDVSHRGGRPGFLDFAKDGAIVVPDTIGNLAVNPRAGMLFIDFGSGDLLQVTGTTEIVWDASPLLAFAGAERLWRLVPTGGNWLRGAFPLRMEFRDFSPMSLAIGIWRQVTKEGWLALAVGRKFSTETRRESPRAPAP